MDRGIYSRTDYDILQHPLCDVFYVLFLFGLLLLLLFVFYFGRRLKWQMVDKRGWEMSGTGTHDVRLKKNQ